jgi:serine/threonine protein kinase
MATSALNGQTNVSVGVASDAVEVSGSRFSVGAVSEKKSVFSNANTPHSTAADSAKKSRPPLAAQTGSSFGGATLVATAGAFPSLGSTLGPYFSVGKLGKGTFCSIHECVNLHYHHDAGEEFGFLDQGKRKCRLAAAKVEVGEFKNSGVLGGEATMLQFLDSVLEPLTVPVYMGHFRGGDDISAIVMEYLPGQDMHWIRDWATKHQSRRISVKDAVYLTADMMLPLLRRMHEVGIVHRDVKPSNCVKRGLMDFCMVDFGLSKSVVVPRDSSLADPQHPWTGKDWIRPPNYVGKDANYRKEREKADFRGTSMYASVRVHQLKDYCARDDMWSLMYVFCDLVSGGLPWMSHAANRDRDACQKLKERIHGEEPGLQDQTERMLWGYEYHTALFKKLKGAGEMPADLEDDGSLPEPLPLSRDEKKVSLLRKAFDHLSKLGFTDLPDYDLISDCIKGFMDGSTDNESILPIDWEHLAEATAENSQSAPFMTGNIPEWDFEYDPDPVKSSLFQKADAEAAGEALLLSGEEADLARLPLELRYRITQMQYNSQNCTTIRPHLALRDWMKAALPIAFGEWDSKKFERGGHRNIDDPYRREFYLTLITKCLKCAEPFQDFRTKECMYLVSSDVKVKCENGNMPLYKRLKISTTMLEPSFDSQGSDVLAISQTFSRLRFLQRQELGKPRAPPPRLSFG